MIIPLVRIIIKRPTIVNTAIFMKRAVALSHDTIVSKKEAPFGCVVARHGEMIGTRYNAVTGTNHPTTHA